MAVRFFPILSSVLDQGIAGICRVARLDEDEAITRAREYLDQNSAAYYSDNAPLHYEDPFCRFAYLYTYVGAHANLVDRSLSMFPPLYEFMRDQVREDGTIHVCSLGGGPGSELLGFVKFAERERNSGNRIDIMFTLIDKVQQWDESWQALINGLEVSFKESFGDSRRDWPIVVHRSFLPLDLTMEQDFLYFADRFSAIQIYVLNHTVSELINYQDEFSLVFSSIVERAAEDSFFLFIDRNEGRVRNFVDTLVDSCPDLILMESQNERRNMDVDEQKTDLGQWYDRMGRPPKLTWHAFYTLAQKNTSDALPF